jgi:uncharacterized membrane protein
MTYLIVGLIVFLGIHSISIVSPGGRDALAARLGDVPWKVVYSLLSVVGFVLIVWGYGDARVSTPVLYSPPTWLRHLALLVLLPVFPLFFSTYLPGRLKSAARHPTLLATKLWATAHLLANGTLADVLLFGAFLAWAVADRISFKGRTQRPMPAAPPSGFNDIIAIVLGLAVYGAFVMGIHAWLFGVSPIAM